MRLGSRQARGFTLLELVFAVMICTTALLGLQATCSGAILEAGNSVNRRAARERARSKLEEVLAGLVDPDDSGSFEDRPEFRWNASSEEQTVGLADLGSGQFKIKVVTLELSYPVDSNDADDSAGDEGRETLKITGVLPPPPPAEGAAAAAPPGG